MKYAVSAWVIILLLSRSVYSQDTLKLNFDEAVKIALEKNVQLRQENNNLESTIAGKRQSIAGFLPNITSGTNYYQITGLQFDQITGSLYSSSSSYLNTNITASYTLFNGLGNIYSVDNSVKLLRSQKENVEHTRQLTIFTVAQQYLQVLLDRQLLRIASENLVNQKTNLSQISGFVEAGTKSLADKLTQEAQVKKLEVLKLSAENTLRRDRAILSQTLMLDPGVEIDPIEPEWGFESILAENYDVNDLYKIALINRPDYKKSMNDREAAEAAVKMARALQSPTLNLFFQYSSSYSSFAISPTTNKVISFPDQYLKNNKQSLYGFQFNIPIFEQYRNIVQKTRAKMTMENLTLAEDNNKLTVFREVQNANLNLISAKNQYFATQSQYDAAVEARKIQQESYNLGVSDLVQLATAIQLYVDAASSRAQAQYTLLFQKVILDYYTGVLSSENLH